jgi:hypothetical protein
MKHGALFSEDRQYRYRLWRIWDEEKPLVMFIGLNPSTAAEINDDPTIRRVAKFARDWGYGGFYMMNLFAIVSADPSVLKKHPDPIGDNHVHINEVASQCHMICFVWGNFSEAKDQAKGFIRQFPRAYCIKKNANGTPAHPLYLAANLKPHPFNHETPIH